MSDFGDFGGCHECGERGTHSSDCSWGHEENNIGGGFNGSSPSLFKIVLWVVIAIIVLAVLLGVAIPGSVIGFLLKVLLFAGLLTLLFK